MKKSKECKMTFEKLYLETSDMNLTDCGCCIWKFCLSNYSNIEKASKSSDSEKVLNLFFDEHKKKEKKI